MTMSDEIKSVNGPIELIGGSKRVDHLPLVAQVLKKLRIAKIIDERVEKHPDRLISIGSCVEALILSILTGSHTLYRVVDSLRQWDLSLVFGEELEAEDFNDERLGRALDQLFKAGISSVNSAVILAAIKNYVLDVSLLHFDTTTLRLHGEYLGSEAEDPEDPDSAPHITYGHSKDKRPDLKQILFGLTLCNDGYIPLLGRVTDGNRSDSLENRFNLTRIKDVLPNPESITLTADSKLFSGDNLLLAKDYGLNIVTLMPKNVNCWNSAFEAVKGNLQTAPVIREQVKIDEDSGKEVVEETWRGVGGKTIHRWTRELENDEKLNLEIEVRTLVIRSTVLAAKKRKSGERLLAKEVKKLAARDKRFAKKSQEYLCLEDAKRAAGEAQKPKILFHESRFEIVEQSREAKRSRSGRPRKDTATEKYSVFVVVWTNKYEEKRLEDWLLRESCFILVTLPQSKASDQGLLALYKGQSGVEGAFKIMKGPASVAPIFLKSRKRIASLGLVYVLALMVYALIQREIRTALAKEEATIPGNRGRTAKPTTQVVFRLFEGITSLPVRLRDGIEVRLLEHVTTEQVAVLKLLGNDLLFRPEIRARISKPLRGERGYIPQEGSFGIRGRRERKAKMRRVRRSPIIEED